MKRIKEKWGITSNFQLLIIFFVFSITDIAVAIIDATLAASPGKIIVLLSFANFPNSSTYAFATSKFAASDPPGKFNASATFFIASADANAFNVAIGHLAGNTGTNDITTGDQNVLIGYNTAASVLTASNQIVIGAGASGTANNAIALGNTSISSIKGQVDFSTYSDARIKKDIRNSDLGLAFINMLRPVKYKLKNPADYPLAIQDRRFTERNEPRPEDNETVYNGLIAQEVKAAMDELGIEWSGWSANESDGKQGLQYGSLTVPLIKAVQEQQDQIEDLMKKYDELAAQNQKLLDMVSN